MYVFTSIFACTVIKLKKIECTQRILNICDETGKIVENGTSHLFFCFGSDDALGVDLVDFLCSSRLSLVSHLLWIWIRELSPEIKSYFSWSLFIDQIFGPHLFVSFHFFFLENLARG